MVDPHHSLWLSGCLLCLGIVGVMVRRSSVSAFLSLELMLCSAIVALTSFDLIHQQALATPVSTFLSTSSAVAGRGFSVMIYSVATAQAFVGLALLIARRRDAKVERSGTEPW